MKNSIKKAKNTVGKSVEKLDLMSISEKFPDEQSCIDFLTKHRWNGQNPVCPHCGCYERIYIIAKGKLFKCGDCRKQFSVKVGTIFEDSHIPLRKWFFAIFIIMGHKKGISSLQLSKDIGITQKTAWFMLHRIRYAVKHKSFNMLKGIVEADETYIGGKNKNRHKNKKIENSQGRSSKDKTPVFGLFERKGKIIAKPVDNTSGKILQSEINKNVKSGSNLMTDEWLGYKGLDSKYIHSIIDHSHGEYVKNDNIHTNNLENFWGLLKRGIIGIYHNVSEKHLHRYCDEFSYRYNTKKENDSKRFTDVLSNCNNNGRLTYKELTKN